MGRQKYSEDKITAILREADGGQPVASICDRYEVSEATFYRWKKKYSAVSGSSVRRMKKLERENADLKRLLAEEKLRVHALESAIEQVKRRRNR